MDVTVPRYERARARIAAAGFTPRIQTRLALFLSSVKMANMPWLGLTAAVAEEPAAVEEVSAQLFKGAETLTRLMQVTEWAPDPLLYWRNVQITAPLFPSPARVLAAATDRVTLDSLALGHALLRTARVAPLIPEGPHAGHRFAEALHRIDDDHAMLAAVQAPLLEAAGRSLAPERRDRIVAERLELAGSVFRHFLDDLAR